MKIAAKYEVDFRHLPLQLGEARKISIAVVVIFEVRVWSGNKMGNTVAMRDSAHLNGDLHRSGAIVHKWQDVAMDVDHSRSIPSLAQIDRKSTRLNSSHLGISY